MTVLAFFIEHLLCGKHYTQDTWLNLSKGTTVMYHDDPILQMRILRLEEDKSLAQKHKHLEFKNNSVHLYAFGVVGWEVGFWR